MWCFKNWITRRRQLVWFLIYYVFWMTVNKESSHELSAPHLIKLFNTLKGWIEILNCLLRLLPILKDVPYVTQRVCEILMIKWWKVWTWNWQSLVQSDWLGVGGPVSIFFDWKALTDYEHCIKIVSQRERSQNSYTRGPAVQVQVL